MSATSKLQSCTKCSIKYPSQEFHHGLQICKKCRIPLPVLKCTYCRSDFRQINKTSSLASFCEKCERNVKQFGKPKSCIFCNINAAFIGSKCQRCTNSERKYGSPITCQQCKQKCAFDRKDDKKKVHNKILCWLCTLSYKRALAKTKQKNQNKIRVHVHNKKVHQEDAGRSHPSHRNDVTVDKLDNQSNLITMLREKSDALERQISIKDAKLLEKEQQITKLQAEHFTKEQEMMNANTTRKHAYDKEIEELHSTVKTLQRDLARLKKAKTNSSASATNSPITA